MLYNAEIEWEDWMEVFIETVLEHANIKASEIYVEDIYDDEVIDLWVDEYDAEGNACVENHYSLHFFEDCAIRGCLMFAHFLWKVEGCDLKLIDQAIYQIHKREDGTRYCVLLAEE